MSLGEQLQQEMTCETVFTIPVFGGIEVKESIVVSWVIIAVLFLLVLFLTHNLKVHNISKRQAFVESMVTKLQNMVGNMTGEEGKEFVPYLITVLLFIGVSNICGIFGFKPPTKDVNVTAGLAIMSIVLIEAAGIRRRGARGWLKSFAEPTPIVAPINIIEVFVRPLSLCMRLFGNVLGAFIVMKLIETCIPVVVPLAASAYFDFFDGLLQAYVFVFLTSLFIKEAIAVE